MGFAIPYQAPETSQLARGLNGPFLINTHLPKKHGGSERAKSPFMEEKHFSKCCEDCGSLFPPREMRFNFLFTSKQWSKAKPPERGFRRP